jgi:hypothetical protein
MPRFHLAPLALALAAALPAAYGQTPVAAPSEALLARVEARNRDAVRAFNTKTVDIQGLPVLAAPSVADEALLRTRDIVSHVLAGRPDVVKAMADFGTRLLIIGKDQVYTDLPEYRDTPNPAFWNERVRGTGGDDVTSFGEENLLNLAGDRYDDMSVGLHEFAHTIDATLTRMDPAWRKGLDALYKRAVDQGLFRNVYAGSSATEYWAELVTMYFDCERPNNWNHGPIITREELRRYQPEAYAFVKATFRLTPAQDWRLRPLRTQPSVVPPPAALKADPAYTKLVYAREFPVLGTAKVGDEAMLKANDTIRKLFAYRHDLLKVLIGQGARLVVLGREERLSDLPEFKEARTSATFDEVRYLDYDPALKLMVVPEENVLGLKGEPFSGECMTINILAKAFYAAAGHRPVDPAFEKKGVEHQQYELRVQRMDTRFDARLRKLFAAARPHWKGTVAARNQEEYWAAGVTAYFDGSGGGQAPLGAPRPITTRETLKAFDPGLYRLVDETMAYGERVDWRFRPFCGGAK